MPITAMPLVKIAHMKEGEDISLRWLLWLGLVIGGVMLLAFPLAKPIWDDELDSIMQGSKPYLTILGGASDTQPPLHFLVFRICETFFGKNLAIFRFISALPAVVSLWYVYLLGKRITPQVGILAVWLAALSPGLILFDRMARYHGLLAMLTTMSVYYGLTALDSGRRRDLVAYGITTFLMLMTYYLSLFVLIAQALVILPRWRQMVYFKPVFLSAALAVAVFLPWFVHGLLSQQHGEISHVEDPAMSLGLHGFLLRLGLPLYSFCFGETVNPWKWPVVLIGFTAVTAASWPGVRCLFSRNDFVLFAVVLCVLLLSAAATSGRLGAFQTVGSMSKRVSFVLPLFDVILSVGVLSFRSRLTQCLCLSALLFVSVYAISNYWRDKQFLNQNYIARWDQAITVMQHRQWGQDTLIVSCSDPALRYYLDQQPQPVLSINATGQSGINTALTVRHPRYLWLVGRDRGDRVAEGLTETLSRQFGKEYQHLDSFGLMPRSTADRYWLQKVLKRPASPDYLWLELYDTQRSALVPRDRGHGKTNQR